MTARVASAELVAASFAVLVQELALIRWIPGQVRVVAYFSNLVLISAFLGLGIGCLLASRRLSSWTWPLSILLLVATAASMSGVAFTQKAAEEHLWLLYFDLPKGAPVFQGIRIPILAIFVLSATTFVWPGHFIAQRLRWFTAEGKPLIGYSSDLGGSLLGVVAFSLLSAAGTPPWLWFTLLAVAGIALFLRREARPLAYWTIGIGVVIAIVVAVERARWYSPYYALDVKPEGRIVSVLANGSLHQIALPLRRTSEPTTQALQITRAGYHLPYRLLKKPAKRVLVLGAGTGNDVSVALDEGASHVTAVEIDPRIIQIGRESHPDQPYSSSRVRVINDDARAFLNDNDETYDLIVFGTLDSMTRLSALSSVRLDTFVYTAESIAAALRRLAPGGGIALYFMVGTDYVDAHIRSIVMAGGRQQPAVVARDFLMFNRIYMAGPAFAHLGARPLNGAEMQRLIASHEVPSDDWPYLYLARRAVTPFYTSLITAILLIAAVSTFVASPHMRQSLRSGGFDAQMFLFGAAFLLVETKLVTEMNLVWGATWITSAVVFGSILLMLLAGTLVMHFQGGSWNIAIAALLASLLFTYVTPASMLAGREFLPRLLISILFIGVPVFFASIAFSIAYRERQDSDAAFGWNMLGAVAGGVIEIASMALGLKAMTLIAATAYLSVALLRARQTPRRIVTS